VKSDGKEITPTEEVIRNLLLNEILYSQRVMDLGVEDPLLDGLLDSIAFMQTVAFCEEVLDISIPGEEVVPDHFENISAIVRLVELRIADR
jgi:acyl carrier protein